jgi:dihydroorotase
MGIGPDLFEDALERAPDHGVTVTVHAEDETRFTEDAKARDDADAWSAYRTAEAEWKAIERACDTANRVGTEIHIAHTSTPEGVDIAAEAGMTTEVTPHHLLLSRQDLPNLGTNGRMNPPLRSEQRRQKLYDRVANGTVDLIATDHAPHTIEEKDAGIWDAPSGVPGVETVLPLLIAQARDPETQLTYERVRDLTATNPAAVFDLSTKGAIEAGMDADLVLFDTTEQTRIRAEQLQTACGWSPFEGFTAIFPEWTMVRGTRVYDRTDGFTSNQGTNVRAE